MDKQLEKTICSMAGEYLVAAHLSIRGYLVAITPKGLPGADLVVHDLRKGRSALIQVKAFTSKNRHPLIGVSAKFDEVDAVLEERVTYPFVFVQVAEDLTEAKFYILSPSQVRRLAKRAYMEWIERGRHRKPVEELKKARQPLGIPLSELERYRDAWDNIWRE